MAYSLFTPMPGLPWYLWPVWPLIFWRIQRLKTWFHANARPGAQMLWGVDRWGWPVIVALSDDLTGRGPAPLPSAAPSRALAVALSGEAFILPCVAGQVGPRADQALNLSTLPRRITCLTGPGLPRPDI